MLYVIHILDQSVDLWTWELNTINWC